MPLRRFALVALAALAIAPSALADADPASDVLYTQRIYLPFFGTKVSDDHALALKHVVDAAWKKGYKVKVALIATRNDLGGVFQLWQKPQTYADFLGRELIFLYKGLLITVMPQGMGVYRFKHAVEKEKAKVATVEIGPGGADGLADAASLAVAKLAGLKAPALPAAKSGGGGGTSVWVLLGIIAGGVAILAAMLVLGPRVYRRRRLA